jgi:uncharacterized zinc-type alcohol dehydrogenase-like protein
MLIRALGTPAASAPLAELTYEAPPLAADEVDVDVVHCAICHSDLHLLDDDWGISRYPLVPGHEVIGHVAAVGNGVHHLTPGDLVGVGWQCGSCGRCAPCRAGDEHLCSGGKRRTCVDQHGGFASRVRAQASFAFKIPAGLDPASAAPLLCAGVTVFAPLERHLKRTGLRVGIVGIGGLGHLAIQFAAAMGAEVVAFDPIPAKRAEAIRLGATELLSPAPADLAQVSQSSFDLILTTTHADLEWNAWLALLRLGGTLCLTGVPTKPLVIDPTHLLDGQKTITGSVIGSPAAMRRMLVFAAEQGVEPLVEHMPMAAANEAVARVRAGAARYRIVLDTPKR